MPYSITSDIMICSIYWSYYDKKPWVSNSWTKRNKSQTSMSVATDSSHVFNSGFYPMVSPQDSILWSNPMVLLYCPTLWVHPSPLWSHLKILDVRVNRSVFISLLWFAKKDKEKSLKEVLIKDLFILYDKRESSVDEKDNKNINSKL